MHFLMLNIFSDKIFMTKHSIMIEIKYKAVYYFHFLENSVQTKVSFSYVAYSISLYRMSDIKQNYSLHK